MVMLISCCVGIVCLDVVIFENFVQVVGSVVEMG